VNLDGSSAQPHENITNLTRRDYVEIVSGKDYMIMSRLSGKYLTANSNGKIQQWEKKNDNSQIWRFESAGNGRFAILNGKNAMTVQNGNNKDGNRMILSQYQNNAAQRFILHKTDDNYDDYYITAECSGNAALDVYDQSSDNGAEIDQWNYWGGDNQKFYIIPLEGSAPINNNITVLIFSPSSKLTLLKRNNYPMLSVPMLITSVSLTMEDLFGNLMLVPVVSVILSSSRVKKATIIY